MKRDMKHSTIPKIGSEEPNFFWTVRSVYRLPAFVYINCLLVVVRLPNRNDRCIFPYLVKRWKASFLNAYLKELNTLLEVKEAGYCHLLSSCPKAILRKQWKIYEYLAPNYGSFIEPRIILSLAVLLIYSYFF